MAFTFATCSYQNYLRRARTENFQDMANLGAFYKAGLDYVGRQIVVFVGKNFPASSMNMDKVRISPPPCSAYWLTVSFSLQAIAYFIHVMESVVHKDYVLIYFHTQTESDLLPDSSFFKQLYGIVDSRYKERLAALYVVHPSWWLKVSQLIS